MIAVDSLRSTQAIAADFAAEQQATARLIDEVQSEEGDLSSVFYSLAAGQQYVDRTVLLKRLDALEAAVRRTTEAGARPATRCSGTACGGRPTLSWRRAATPIRSAARLPAHSISATRICWPRSPTWPAPVSLERRAATAERERLFVAHTATR